MLALAQLTPQAYSLARHAPRTRCRDGAPATSPSAVSLGAGMVGGCGRRPAIAYPLDTLKTKLQAREDSGASSSSSPLALAADIVRARASRASTAA